MHMHMLLRASPVLFNSCNFSWIQSQKHLSEA